jgi:hypothetical protein
MLEISCSRIVESALCSRTVLFQHDLCRYFYSTVFAVGVEYGGRGSHSMHYNCRCIIFADTLLLHLNFCVIIYGVAVGFMLLLHY